MVAASSLNQSMEKAVQHYSALFKLPSYKRMLLVQASICLIVGLLSTITLFQFDDRFVNGLFLGLSLFIANFVADNIVNILLRHDSIYDLRRITGLSLFNLGFWLFFVSTGVAIATVHGIAWWIRLCLLGFSAAIILRSMVLFSTSPTNYRRLFVASIFNPFACIIPLLVFWMEIGYPLGFSMLLFFIFSPVIGILSSLFFILILNNVERQALGFSPIPLFKAFLLNWVVNLNSPFERFLEDLGENQDVEVSLIQFSSSKPKAVIVVPSIHPGPFKTIGSSLLPSMLKSALEKELGCVACVPHGLFGHEFDLASQGQSQAVINRIVELAAFEVHENKATPFVKTTNERATACCQVFGNFAFVSFTLAPRTTEDLPQELGVFIQEESQRHGLASSVVVNAHNSIDGTTSMEETLDELKRVGADSIIRASSLEQLPFEVGAVTVIPKEFGLKEGLGPGGITVVVVKVGQQKTAYVVIDGNNMVSGLRENIIATLNSIGIAEGEIFTTDTHSVNALILGNRGYHPVGEAIPHDVLIGYIKKAVLAAMSDLESVKATCISITIPNVKVIGGKQLEKLCLLIDRTLQKAKKTIIPLLALSGLLLMLVLMFV